MKRRSPKELFTLINYFFLLFFIFFINSLIASEPPELATLLARVQVTPPAQVAFTEQRQNRLMKEPLVLSGRLAYPGAGRLEKIVEEPFRETLRVDGDEIAIVRDGSERRVSLRNRKTFRVMLGSIEAIMAGGAATLEEHFEARVSGDDERWRIDLQPRSRRLAGQLEAMAVSGVGDRVESIRFTLPDGEWQLLEIRHEEPVHE